MIVKYRYPELPVDIATVLNEEIERNFGSIPIVKETQWAKPDWTIIKLYASEVVSFYNIIQREVFFDDMTFQIAGINNVITPKEHRGRGYSSQMLNLAPSVIFDELACDAGLLLCADELIPFYKKLGWYDVQCPVFCQQPIGKIKWEANTMVLSEARFNPTIIDLNGLPW